MAQVGPSPVSQAYGSPVQFRVLGPLRVLADNRELQLGGPKQRSVLALLLASANRPVSIDRLIDGVWGADPPEGGRHTVQAYVSSLRSDHGLTVERVGDAYRLVVEPTDLDVARFEALLDEARRLRATEPARASDLLVQALGEWQGRPYADLPQQEVFQSEITRLDELRLAALEERVEADLTVGRHAAVVGELEVLTREHPFRERLYALLMLALYRSGRQAEALRSYQRLREVLSEELGIDPSQSLQELENQILRQDPALESPLTTERTENVALLFTDFEASTALWEAQPAAMNDLISEHDRVLNEIVDAQGGRVFKQVGDGALVAFPTVGQAVAVAEGMQRQLLGRVSSMRMGIDIGVVEARGDDYFGSPLNRCARLLAAAHGGQVLLSDEAASQLSSERVRDLGEHRLKGVGRPMKVFQLLADGLRSDFPELRVAATDHRLERSGFGRTIRGFELRELIGEGDFGVVYRAYQASVGREVAIKVIRPEYANRPVFVRRFEAEARLVAQLEHPHIVSLYDYWRDPDGAYLVMRYLRGGSLRTALARGPWNPPAALALLDQIGSALAYAHRQGVVHRDLKPGNVLLDEEGRAYLTDFGIATRRPDAVGSPVTTSLAYIPPEELRGEPITARTDIYSLGVLALELLTGHRPIAGHSLPSIRELRSDLSPALDEVVTRATADRPAQRFEQVEDFLRALRQAAGIDVVGAAESAIDATSSKPLRNPYKGLRAFQETDAPDFFGRDALIDRLMEAVRSHRLVVVVGPSGSGKSSVVRAGLLPALRAGASPGSSDWLVAEMFPGTHPFEELETALLRVAVHRPERMIDELTADDRGLLRVVKQILPNDDTELLLVIDQFEELFSMVANEDVRRLFLDSLVALCTDGRGRARVVATLRADFFHRPLDFSDFGRLLEAGLVPLTPLDSDGLALSISRPARSVGLELEPGLVSTIVSDVSGQPGGLPLMQHALTELFQRRRDGVLTIEGYRATGGVLGALGRRAEELYESLTESGQTAARQLFLRLVTVDEQADDTRRRVRQSELRSLDIDQSALDEAIGQFGAHRLLSFDRDPITRSATVEVAHEALLREWQRLRSWIDERREDLVLHRRLGASIQEWRDSNEDHAYLLEGGRLEQFETWARDTEMALSADENRFLAESRAAHSAAAQRRRRRRRGILAGFGAAAVISLVLAGVAYTNQQRAQSETRSATARELAGSANDSLEEDPERSILLALEAVETTRSAGEAALPEAISALQQAVQTSRLMARFPGAGSRLAVTANGRWLLAVPFGQPDATVRDAFTGEKVATLQGPGGAAIDVGVGPEGLAAISYDTTALPGHPAVIVWDLESGARMGELSGPPDVYERPTFSPDGGLLAVTGLETGLAVFDAKTGDSVLSVDTGGAFVFDGAALLVANQPAMRVEWFDLGTGEKVDQLETPGFQPQILALEPGGRRLASTSQTSNRIEIWDLAARTQLLSTAAVSPYEPAWNTDGTSVAYWGNEGIIRLLDPDTGEELITLEGHTSGVSDGVFHPDGERLMSAAEDEEVRIWDITPGGPAVLGAVRVLSGEPGNWSFSTDGSELIATTDAGTVERIVLATGESREVSSEQFVLSLPPVYPVISEDWQTMASLVAVSDEEGGLVGLEGTVRNLETQEVLRNLPPCTVPTALSSDGALLLLNAEKICVTTQLLTPPPGTDLTSRIIEVATGDEILNLGDRAAAWGSFSPGGAVGGSKYLAVVTVEPPGNDFALELYDMTTRDLVATLGGWSTPDGGVIGNGFDVQGRYLAYGTGIGIAKVYDLEILAADPDSEAALEVTAHKGLITSVAVSSDGTLATAGFDSVYRLWDFPTGDLLVELEVERLAGFPSIGFSPDDSYLLYQDANGVFRKYLMDLDALVELAHSRITRTLTDAECQTYLHLDGCPAG